MDKEIKQILIVEDEKLNREIIKRVITKKFPEIKIDEIGALNKEALDMLKNGGYHIAFIDMRLPVDQNSFPVNGEEYPGNCVIKIIQKYQPECLIVAMSADGDCIKEKTHKKILKPFSLEIIIDIVSTIYMT